MGEEEARQDGTQSESMQQQLMQEMEQHPMASLLQSDFDVQALRRGQVVEGVIVQLRPSEILVDVGAKSEGVILGRELERLGSEGLSELSEGDSLLVYVVTPEDKNGNPILSISKAQAERDWRDAER
ncbi:MAG: S1 RNA-binding domain-containing protein, partial [Anaerolineae bacterium]